MVIIASLLSTAVFADTYSELPIADTWVWSGQAADPGGVTGHSEQT